LNALFGCQLRSIVWNWTPAAELCVEKKGHRAHGTAPFAADSREIDMHQLIYLVGLIVVILAILSFFGLR
jgi:hypothetical protein